MIVERGEAHCCCRSRPLATDTRAHTIAMAQRIGALICPQFTLVVQKVAVAIDRRLCPAGPMLSILSSSYRVTLAGSFGAAGLRPLLGSAWMVCHRVLLRGKTPAETRALAMGRARLEAGEGFSEQFERRG